MGLFILGMILTLIGAAAVIRGNTSRFNSPSGGGSRIPPEAQVRLNESIQKVVGTKETTDSYFLNSNTFKPNIFGLTALVVGIALVALSYFLKL